MFEGLDNLGNIDGLMTQFEIENVIHYAGKGWDMPTMHILKVDINVINTYSDKDFAFLIRRDEGDVFDGELSMHFSFN